VAESCADDPLLETRVLRLLEAHEAERGVLDLPLSLLIGSLLPGVHEDDPPEHDEGVAASETAPGATIGPYRVVRPIGRGGMGSVYLAERADGAYEQRVALKVVNAGILTEELVRRFRRERQILARLDHPGIARLLHGGLTPSGHPYLAMELVEGVTITEWAAAVAGGVRPMVELVLQVCDAVHYAHGRLVVHRDLKPSNIVVDGEGRVRLLDFGIARLLTPEAEGETRTRTGLLLLTPEYAAPELLYGEAVTTATDVYALGVVLHEMLTGARPRPEDAHSLRDLVRLAEREPPAPSRAPDLPAGRRRQLAGDLDAVILKALRPRPDRRYGSVQALADDLRAWLERRPVGARPDTRLYRAGRFVRRNAVAVGATIALALSVLAGLAGTSIMAASARTEAARSEAVRAFLFSLWEGADPRRHGGDVPTALDLLERGRVLADSMAAEAGPEVRADMLTTLGFLYGELGEYERAVDVFDRAVAESRSSFGRDERTATALDGLAQNLIRMGRTQEAGGSVLESLAMRQALGLADSLVAGSYSTLGVLRSDEGRLEEALEAHRVALDLDRAGSGERSHAVATDLNNVGSVLSALGDYEEAERHHREALAIRRALPDDLPGLAISLGHLAGTRRELDDFEEAEALEREALAVREAALGPDHPDVAISLNQLGITLQRAGRQEEADSVLSRAVELYARTLGSDHPETVGGLNNLATARFRAGEYGRAAEAQEGVVAAARAADPGLETPDAITMLHNLGVMRLRAGDVARAEADLTEALDARVRVLGDGHVATAASLRWMCELRRRQGRHADAETVARGALASFEEAFPPGHTRISETQICLGAALLENGRASEALRPLRSALEAREAVAEGGTTLAEARAWLGIALVRTGSDPATGRRLLEAALRDYDAAGRSDEPEAILAREELAGR
jgi:serine/threonine-protein kinase